MPEDVQLRVESKLLDLSLDDLKDVKVGDCRLTKRAIQNCCFEAD